MTQPLVKLNEFHAIGGNVFHASASFHGIHGRGYQGGNKLWFYPAATLNIHQPGETEEQSFYPAQSVSLRLTPDKCQELSAFFARVARQLQGVE